MPENCIKSKNKFNLTTKEFALKLPEHEIRKKNEIR
jgi:hypothetical protein